MHLRLDQEVENGVNLNVGGSLIANCEQANELLLQRERLKITMNPMIPLSEREQSCLEEVKEKIKEDNELSQLSSLFSDEFLLVFVRSRKYDPKKAFTTLQNYIKVRKSSHKHIFKGLVPSKAQLDITTLRVFQQKDEMGRIAGILRIADWNPDELSWEELFKIGVLYTETALTISQDTQRNGLNLILDTKGFSLKHARQVTPFLVKDLVAMFWGSFPTKYNKIFIVNSPMSFTMIYNMMKHFLPLKIRERLQLFGEDLRKFHKLFMGPENLPVWLEGCLTDKEAFDMDFVHYIKLREMDYANMTEVLHQ